jgi:hypothetical protein
MWSIELSKNVIILRKIDNNDYLIEKIKEFSDKQKIKNSIINRDLEKGLLEIKLSLINYTMQQMGFIIYSILEMEGKKLQRFSP